MSFFDIYWKVFIVITVIYSFLSAFSKVFYKDKPMTELSLNEMRILNGEAGFDTRISVIFRNLLFGIMFIPGHISSVIISFILYFILS